MRAISALCILGLLGSDSPARAGDETVTSGSAPGAVAPATVTPEAMPPPKADEPKPIAGYDAREGFFLQSPDGKFLLRPYARLQVRYTYFGKDEHEGDPGHDESYFELERARLGMMGHLFDPRLKYRIELEADTDASDKGVLFDTYIQYVSSGAFAVGAGQFHPNFLRIEYISAFKQQMVERSLANEFFNIDRNIGLWVEGEPAKWFYYNAAITNGIDTVNAATGGGAANFNLDNPPAFVGKLDFTLTGDHRYSYEGGDLKNLSSPLAVVGASFLAEDYNRATGTFITTEGDVWSFGLDAVFKVRGFSLLAEYAGRFYDQDGDGEGSSYAHGFTVQGGFFVSRSPDIELTTCISAVYGTDGPEHGDGYMVGPGVNWYVFKNHNVKLSADVSWVDLDDDMPVQTELLRTAAGAPDFTSTAGGFAEGEQGVLTRVQFQLVF